MRKSGCGTQMTAALTWYFPLAPRRVPSLSQVTMGLGFPKAVQVMVILPPSLASMYWGGVSVKVGGAAKNTRKVRDRLHHPPVQNSGICRNQGTKAERRDFYPVSTNVSRRVGGGRGGRTGGGGGDMMDLLIM